MAGSHSALLEDTSESAITVTSVPTTGSMSAQEEEHYGHYIEQEQVHLIRCGKYVESTITILIFTGCSQKGGMQ